MCQDIKDKNTKPKNYYQKHDSCFKTQRKNTSKRFANLETEHKTEKNQSDR